MKIGVTILLVLILALTQASARRFCQKSCNCRSIYKPVCGKSGRTHANACFATCAGDVIISKKACPTKCLNPKPVYKKKCHFIKYGRNGRRNHCCTWKVLNGVKLNRKCHYKGRARYSWRKKSCKMQKRNGGEQLRCCHWKKHQCGKKVTRTKKRCKWTGPLITKKFKKGCHFKKQKGNYVYKTCCQTRVICKINRAGKKKCKRKKRCKKIGNSFKTVVKNRCGYTRPNKAGTRYRRCCSSTFRCYKGKRCVRVVKKCKKTGHVIKRKKMKVCNWRTVGKSGRRKRCCSWIHDCRTGKKCTVKAKRCYWSGCSKTTRLVGKCKWKYRTKNVKQKLCCSKIKHCSCGKCHSSKKKCVWKGSKITRHSHKKCNWVALGNNCKRRKCCTHKKTCFRGKCERTKRCHWSTKKITVSIQNKCVWSHITKNSKRRKCCSRTKRCEGKKCKFGKTRCKLLGYVVFEKNGKNCLKKKQTDGSYRLKCCNYKKSCTHYKNGKKHCKKYKRKCYVTGKRRWYIKRTSIQWRTYKKTATRKAFCKWTDYCVGSRKNCVPTGKRCKWIGLIRESHVNTVCKVKRRGKFTKQEQCCTVQKVCRCKRVGDRNGCSVRRTNCKWVGAVWSIKVKRKCQMVKYKGGMRRRCCHHVKRCKGKDCTVRKTKCSWKGGCIRQQTKTSCFLAPFGNNGKRKKCCGFRRTCVGRKCQKWKKLNCAFTGKCVTRKRRTVCYWKKKGQYKKRLCCSKLIHRRDGKIFKVGKKVCRWTGKKVALTRVYFKRKYTKYNHKSYSKHCTKIYRCSCKGRGKETCKYVKTQRCKTIKKVYRYKKVVCANKRWVKKSSCGCGNALSAMVDGRKRRCYRQSSCKRKQCTETTFQRIGGGRPKVISRRRWFTRAGQCGKAGRIRHR